MAREEREANEANLDELGSDPAQVGPRSGGRGGDAQRLAEIEDASGESIEELNDTDQALEAAALDGLEDAASHPERPTHTHLEYGHPDDFPSKRRDDEE